MSAPEASQNGSPPPPPQPTGSPFGRFLTQPVFLVALLALMVSAPVVALVLRGGGAGDAGVGGHEPTVLGTWAGSSAGSADVAPVVVELTISSLGGGTMARGGCRGELTRRNSGARRYVFTYREQSGLRRCPRRSTVIVEPRGDDRLRFEERRRGRVVAEGILSDAS